MEWVEKGKKERKMISWNKGKSMWHGGRYLYRGEIPQMESKRETKER